jgi:hypothetical protein
LLWLFWRGGVSWTIYLCWLLTMMLPISAS